MTEDLGVSEHIHTGTADNSLRSKIQGQEGAEKRQAIRRHILGPHYNSGNIQEDLTQGLEDDI
jgi:hypothetical protein